ncbi:MAG TPA: hypothetical protein VLO30_04625, partial [Chthoniobacterales bacterium]|nr:hypothetical protein [Chthoniobacterales bacterium]
DLSITNGVAEQRISIFLTVVYGIFTPTLVPIFIGTTASRCRTGAAMNSTTAVRRSAQPAP